MSRSSVPPPGEEGPGLLPVQDLEGNPGVGPQRPDVGVHRLRRAVEPYHQPRRTRHQVGGGGEDGRRGHRPSGVHQLSHASGFHKQRPVGFGNREDPQGRRRHHAQASPAPHHEAHQVEAGHVLHHPAAQAQRAAVPRHQGESQHVVPGGSVHGPEGPGGTRGHRAPHRPRAAAGGVQGNPLAVGRQGPVQVVQGGPGSHGEGEVGGLVDVQAGEAAGGENHEGTGCGPRGRRAPAPGGIHRHP